MKRAAWITLSALLGAHLASAEIAPLTIDPAVKAKDRTSINNIMAAHSPIPNSAGTAQAARLAILRSMGGRAGMQFIFEEEGTGFVIARLDFKRNPLWMRIEYSPEAVQVKYLDGQKDFECKNNHDGICYENHRHYFSFLARLNKKIRHNLAML